MRKPDNSFIFIFIMKIRKSIWATEPKVDTKFGNNSPFSAPQRALREIIME